ncbi:MAG: SAM-dependent methyltransferase [Gammaproteobacteria bacterium]|nr:SAM-dependent methyltransferase [Gammaproteobacteria bacterium]
MPSSLPSPSPDAQALSDQLLSQIIAEIKANQSISFARYMELALYAPKFGYYRNPLQKLGAKGDFVTAPEISPLFSYCLANQCAEILRELKQGDILEFGAGTGSMAADILIALKKQNQLPDHYYILELSATLKSTQRATIEKKIPDCLERVIWLNELPSEKIQGVILANEVLDAMPVNLFKISTGINECAVTLDENNKLALCLSEKENSELICAVEKYDIEFPENYLSEINLYLPGWIKSIADSLSRGAILLIDYGFPRHEYYHPDRTQGTLMCHYQHHSHTNPLIYAGIQDITAHVDFTAAAESAENNNLNVAGFANQAAFLLNCDLLSFIDNTLDEKNRFNQNLQIKKLTSPNEMGELFKVMALTKNYDVDLMGFKTMNQLEKL